MRGTAELGEIVKLQQEGCKKQQSYKKEEEEG